MVFVRQEGGAAEIRKVVQKIEVIRAFQKTGQIVSTNFIREVMTSGGILFCLRKGSSSDTQAAF